MLNRYVFYWNSWTDQYGFGTEATLRLHYTVVRKSGYFPLDSGTF